MRGGRPARTCTAESALLLAELFHPARWFGHLLGVTVLGYSLLGRSSITLISRATDGLRSRRRSIRESVRRPADAAAAYVSASVQVARCGGPGGDHPEVGGGRAGAVSHQDCHR